MVQLISNRAQYLLTSHTTPPINKMEQVNITELETRYFADLFSCCDTEKTGKIHTLKATEMFRSSDIPNDVLENVRIISICSCNSNYFGYVN